MVDAYRQSDAIVLAIPAGGVPVAAVIAQGLKIPLEVAVVSKITLRRTPRLATAPWHLMEPYA